jgi:expansin (peptidoglycan-binding protein)
MSNIGLVMTDENNNVVKNIKIVDSKLWNIIQVRVGNDSYPAKQSDIIQIQKQIEESFSNKSENVVLVTNHTVQIDVISIR